MTTGEKIKHYRKLLHMTQTELAERCGVQKAAISKWEHGTIDITQTRMVDLAQIFGISPIDLLPDRINETTIERLTRKIKNLSDNDLTKLEIIIDAWTGGK